MKYFFYALIIFALGLTFYGVLNEKEIFVLDVYDSYYVVSYKFLGLFIFAISIFIGLIAFLLRRIKTKYDRN